MSYRSGKTGSPETHEHKVNTFIIRLKLGLILYRTPSLIISEDKFVFPDLRRLPYGKSLSSPCVNQAKEPWGNFRCSLSAERYNVYNLL